MEVYRWIVVKFEVKIELNYDGFQFQFQFESVATVY